MEHWACFQIPLCDPECLFHYPETVVLRYHLLRLYDRVRDISLPSVPLGILGNPLLVDDNAHVVRYLKKLVVASPVDVLFLDGAGGEVVPQTLDAALPVLRIVLCPVLGLGQDEAFLCLQHSFGIFRIRVMDGLLPLVLIAGALHFLQ